MMSKVVPFQFFAGDKHVCFENGHILESQLGGRLFIKA